MNRLSAGQQFASSPQSSFFSSPENYAATLPAQLPSRESRRRLTANLSRTFSLFAPVHYEPGYSYPLLVWLHDDGGNERQLQRLMPYVSVRNYVAGAIRGTAPTPGDSRTFGWDFSAAGVAEAIERAEECVDAARSQYNVHDDRIFIAGYGAGGSMALAVALAAPEQFAGAISIGGAAPRRNAPLRRINYARRLPLMLSYCKDSESYAPQRVGDDLRLFYAGGFPLTMFQYPGEQELTTGMLRDMDRWIMQRVCGASAPAAV